MDNSLPPVGGGIIVKDGEKFLQLHGFKLINKRPVKATIYYRWDELELFLYNFLNRDDMFGVFNPDPIWGESHQEKSDTKIKSFVQKVLQVLANRFSYIDMNRYLKLALSIIVNAAFESNIWIANNGTIYIPFSPKRETQTISQSSITLPEDVLRREISSRLTSPTSSTMLRLAAKAVRYAKYEYENHIKLVPEQALVVLSELYGKEKDSERKEYLFSLAMMAYSMIESYRDRDDFKLNIHLSDDIAIAIFTNIINVTGTIPISFSMRLTSDNVDVVNSLVNAGVMTTLTTSLGSYSFSECTSLSDNFIPFVEKMINIQKSTGNDYRIRLYDDLRSGKFTMLYDCRLMVDAIKKGFIKLPLNSFENVTDAFFRSVDKCSQEDRDLLRKFIEPNPVTDYFLGGIKPTTRRVINFLKENKDETDFPISIYTCLCYGMEFSDKEVDYELLINEGNLWENPGDAEWEAPYDGTIRPERDIIFNVENLGENKRLALIQTDSIPTRVAVIKWFGKFFLEDWSTPVAPLFIKYMAKAFDSKLQEIVSFLRVHPQLVQAIEDLLVDETITDLEMYVRYVVNIKSVITVATL